MLGPAIPNISITSRLRFTPWMWLPDCPRRRAELRHGNRGRENEPATAEDLKAMRRLVAEGVSAGAVGFSTSGFWATFPCAASPSRAPLPRTMKCWLWPELFAMPGRVCSKLFPRALWAAVPPRGGKAPGPSRRSSADGPAFPRSASSHRTLFRWRNGPPGGKRCSSRSPPRTPLAPRSSPGGGATHGHCHEPSHLPSFMRRPTTSS